MLAAEEAVPFHFPGLGIHHDVDALSLNDIQEILSALESNDQPASPSSGSERFNQSIYSVDERKKRRMISNRESARRSRWRKKQHLEDLKKEAARLSIANRDLKNRLACVMNQLQALMLENERLISEYGALWAKLSDMYAAMQCNHINREN